LTYTYKWHWELETQKALLIDGIFITDAKVEEVRQKFEDTVASQIYEQLAKKTEEQGVFIKINKVNVVVLTEIKEQELVARVAFFRCIADTVFESDKKLTGSISATLVVAFKYILDAVVAILVAYFVVEAIRRVIQSIVTTQSTVMTIEYDEEGNIVSKTVTSAVQPSLAGLGSIIVMFFILMLFIFGASALKK